MKCKGLVHALGRSICTSNRIMANKSGSTERLDHLQLTSNQQREPGLHNVIVSEIQDISPTVKRVVLSCPLTPVPIRFKAGQWIDMFIPNVKTVGGFSMTSSPDYLQKTGRLELAIKYSTWPPSNWIHKECKVGSEVSVRTGGDFFFDTDDPVTALNTDRVLLLAGGVGINPLASMINQIQDKSSKFKKIQSSLLFSAQTSSELLFKERFESFAEISKGFGCRFFVTGDKATASSPSNLIGETFTKTRPVKVGRIGLEDIRAALEDDLHVKEAGDTDKLRVYICGPPPMIQSMEEILKSLNITENVFYEKWWQ